MLTVVPVDQSLLERVLDATFPHAHEGLTRHAFARHDAAQSRTIWGADRQRRWALVDGGDLLATAQEYDLVGTLDKRQVRICGIGGLWCDPTITGDPARILVDRLIDRATGNGSDLALLFATAATTAGTSAALDGFEVVPTLDVQLTVKESVRHGAPMTMVRGGEDRDLAAVAAMGQTRADPVRFHLDRDVDFVKHAVTRKRLLAGLGSTGVRQLQFVIAEEGITAAAYVVISCVDRAWTIEECGDRDPSGARVGALLQTLIASEPGERRPVIRGWLPPGFTPPQVTVTPVTPSTHVVLGKILGPAEGPLRLSSDEVLYWRSDVF